MPTEDRKLRPATLTKSNRDRRANLELKKNAALKQDGMRKFEWEA